MTISRLTKVDLRELWKHESFGFSKWLSSNLDYLSEAIGINLNFIGREVPAGPFSADILAEDAEGTSYIIENQLERTDHSHLGQIITYMSNLDAKCAIWITKEPRPEHERAIEWMNELLPSDTSIYLIKLEAYKIGNSEPAPMFTVIAGPTETARQAGEKKKELADRHVKRLEFWRGLVDAYKKRGTFFSNISPSKENWISTGAGKSSISYHNIVTFDGMRVELDIWSTDKEANKRIFDQLILHKAEIEQSFGSPLDWFRLDNMLLSKISFSLNGKGLRHQEEWPDLQLNLVDTTYRFRAALHPYIETLR